MGSSQFLQKNSSSFFSCPDFPQNAGRFNTSSMSWSWKSFRANTRCSLLAQIMLCAVIQSSHQNAQHWKQYKLWELFLSQFPHLTPVVLHSWMANTSSKLLMRKLVGRSFKFPLLGTLLSLLHSGHVMISCRPLVRRISFKQWRQKLCKHGSIFGSVNVVMHSEHDTSSWRLLSKVFKSMIIERRKTWSVCSWKSVLQWSHVIEHLIILANHRTLFIDVFDILQFLRIVISFITRPYLNNDVLLTDHGASLEVFWCNATSINNYRIWEFCD